MFFHGHASFWVVFSSANRFGKKQTPWDMKSTTTTFCSTQTKLTGDACLYVQIDVKYPSAQWIIVLVTFQ